MMMMMMMMMMMTVLSNQGVQTDTEVLAKRPAITIKNKTKFAY
jgi:hypothetical protein